MVNFSSFVVIHPSPSSPKEGEGSAKLKVFSSEYLKHTLRQATVRVLTPCQLCCKIAHLSVSDTTMTGRGPANSNALLTPGKLLKLTEVRAYSQ